MPITAQMVLPNTDALTRDTSVNTFSFNRAMDSVAATAITAAVNALMSVVGKYLSPSISRTVPPQIKYYDLSGPGAMGGAPHGSPSFTSPLALLPAPLIATGIPPQACVIFRLDTALEATQPVEGPESDIPTGDFAQDEGAPATHRGRTRPRSRYRGRIYIGPLTASLTAGSVRGQVAQPPVADMGAAFLQFLADQPTWSVWSRRDAAMRPVSQIVTPLEFGTQRGRVPKATSFNIMHP